jgi:hypothetical protein
MNIPKGPTCGSDLAPRVLLMNGLDPLAILWARVRDAFGTSRLGARKRLLSLVRNLGQLGSPENPMTVDLLHQLILAVEIRLLACLIGNQKRDFFCATLGRLSCSLWTWILLRPRQEMLLTLGSMGDRVIPVML